MKNFDEEIHIETSNQNYCIPNCDWNRL